MFASETISLLAPALPQSDEKPIATVSPRIETVSESSATCDPEQHLWKISARATFGCYPMVDPMFLGLFLIVVISITSGCISEIQELVRKDALTSFTAKVLAIQRDNLLNDCRVPVSLKNN
jgi:hypothetical protein